MTYNKVKDLRMGRRKMPPKTQRQLEASRNSGNKTAIIHLSKHQFKKGHIPANKGKKLPEKTKNKIREKMLGKKNSLGRKCLEENKIKLSMRMLGKPCNPKSREQCIKNVLLNNPMKNSEIAKKNGKARRKKISKELMDKIIKEFKEGKSIVQLSKENKIYPKALSREIREHGINFNANERFKIYGKTNPNIIKNQLKGGQNEK